VAGRGNNGGDGFVAAAELAARGREVSVILLCERDSLQGDAALAARGWKYPVLPFNPQAIGKPALIIGALFGAGLNRPVKGDPLQVIEAVDANSSPGARGHVVVLSGELASTGAARLAARGALRAGAGLVTMASPRDALAVNAAALTAIMVRAVDTVVEFADMLGDRRLSSVVIGPGAGV